MQEGEEIKVNTFDGPVTYVFKEDPEPFKEGHELIKKKHKKKKKEKKKRYIQPEYHQSKWEILIMFIVTIFIGFGAYYYLNKVPADLQTHVKLRELVNFGHNTTSIRYDKQISYEYVKNILSYYNHQPLICMHHVNFSENYQICLLDRLYLIINPVLRVVKNSNITEIIELSISCLKEQPRKRFECVSIEWTDYFYNFTATFCGEIAMHLQMMKDEFEGNKHCFLS